MKPRAWKREKHHQRKRKERNAAFHRILKNWDEGLGPRPDRPIGAAKPASQNDSHNQEWEDVD